MFTPKTTKELILLKIKFCCLAALFVLISSGCSHLTTKKDSTDLPESNQHLSANSSEEDTAFYTDDFTVPETENPSVDRLSAQNDPEKQPYLSTGHEQTVYENGSSKLSEDNLNKDDGTDNNGSQQSIADTLDESLVLCETSQEFWQKGELEKALVTLDNAYSLVLSTQTADDSSKYAQQIEDLRFMIAKRILEIYASRHIVVSGNHNAIPVTINQHVQSEINLFTAGKEKRFFLEAYKRSGKYRPMIVPMLREAGIPEELSWLPLIESGFKENALSHARALGLWQFIPSTGYKFGLKRDRFLDERLDPVKSTKAAIAYLKELHQIFGDWTTVLAAYNCGEGRVLRVIRGQNVNYLDNFWDLYQRLPRETARYVPRFLATLHIIQNLEKYDLDSVEVYDPPEFETIEVNRQVNLKTAAKAMGVSKKELVELNPELRYKLLPNYTYPLRVPPDTGERLLAKIDTLPIYSKPRSRYVYHKVRKGETLSTIARRYRTSVRSIARTNRLNRRNLIVAGKTLKIPTSYKPSTKPRRSKTYTSKSTVTHVVKRGDSLWNLARQYHISTKDIQKANKLHSTKLSIGQKLKIPTKQSMASSSGNQFETYLVKPGDSPFVIARQHNMPLNRFLKINRLTRRSTIYPGQKYYVE
jgi:membrane-bound lytic murein transglycosylase D